MRTLLKILVIVVIGVGLLGFAASLMLPSAARKGVQLGAGSALGVDASLSDVNAGIGLGNTDLGLSGLALASPSEFGEAPLLNVGEAAVEVGTFSLLSDTIEVPVIRLDGLKLHLVQDGKRSNLGQVLQHVRGQQKGGADPTAPDEAPGAPAEEAGSAGGGKRMAFGTVSVAGVGVGLEVKGIPGLEDKSYEWIAPAFEMDLSDEANRARVDSVAALTERLIEELATRALGASASDLPPQVMALLKGGTSLEEAGKELLDEAKEKAKSEAEDKLKDAVNKELSEGLGKELGGALDGLLGKDK